MTMKSFNVNGVLFDEHFQNSDSKVVNLIIINSKQNIVVFLQQNEIPAFVERLHYTSLIQCRKNMYQLKYPAFSL